MLPINFKDEQIIDGVRYYIKDDDSLVIADRWDAMFKPQSTGKPVKTRWKGENPDRRKLWMKDKRSY